MLVQRTVDVNMLKGASFCELNVYPTCSTNQSYCEIHMELITPVALLKQEVKIFRNTLRSYKMKLRSQPNPFVNSAHVEDLLNYCTVPLFLLSSSVHPWAFKDFLSQQAELILHLFCRCVLYVCPVLSCEAKSFPLHVPYYPVSGFPVSSSVSLWWTGGSRMFELHTGCLLG